MAESRSNRTAKHVSMIAGLMLAGPPVYAGTPPSPVDLAWLRRECGDGALAHHASGRIYLTELAVGESVFVAPGNQPEFSPDSSKLAWIDGRTAKGRMRKGDPTIRTIAANVDSNGGVHWLDNDEVLVVLRREGTRKWFRVSLDGAMAEVPELTQLGTGGYECDVRLSGDGIWSYVAGRSWKTSDGKSGMLPGTCSVSLSLDGKSATSLHNPHEECTITAIRSGGYSGTLWWPYLGGFDNHRWSSNDSRFIVAVDEHHQTMVVMTPDGRRCTRMGTLGRAEHMMYGDFTVGGGIGAPWPTRQECSAFTQPGVFWPPQTDDLVFIWDKADKSNTLQAPPGAPRLCRVEPRGRAKISRFSDMDLAQGAFLAEETINRALLDRCREKHALTVEAVITPHAVQQAGDGRIISFSSGANSGNFALSQREGELVWHLRTDAQGREREAVLLPMEVGVPHHVIVSYAPGRLRCYFDGRRIRIDSEFLGDFRSWTQQHLVFGDAWAGGCDWAGNLEGIAIYARFLDTNDAQQHYEAYMARLSERTFVPQWTVTAKLTRKEPIPEPTLYPQTLVAYQYWLPTPPEDGFEAQEFLVVHWGTLNGTVQADVRELSLGSTYRMTLERFEDHPQLRTVRLIMNPDACDTPLFYDVGDSKRESMEGG